MKEYPTRRRFLAGSVGAMSTLPVGTASGDIWDDEDEILGDDDDEDDIEEPDWDDLWRAINRTETYLRRELSEDNTWYDDDLTHWDTTVRFEGAADLRTTVYYALLTDRIWGNEDERDDCLSYLLDRRSTDGGWDDTVTNFGMLLLFDRMDDHEYESVVEDIFREIDAKNQSLMASKDEAGFTDRFRMRLLYAVLSDDHSFDELFPRELPIRAGDLMALTSAFDGEAVSAQDQTARPSYITRQLAYFLLGATAYDRELDEDETQLVEVAENVLLSRRLTNGAWNTVPTTLFATFALVERGYSWFDGEVGTPVRWIADNRLTDEGRVESYRLPVRDTTLVQKALLAAGSSPDAEFLQESAQWLSEARTPQTVGRELDREPAPFRRHHGHGWGYMPHAFSNWDDTAVALGSLSALTDGDLDEQIDFLRRVQNRDGSWSAYTTDFAPFQSTEIADEARLTIGDEQYQLRFGYIPAPDITGNALSTLGMQGDTVDDDRHIDDAVSYLRENRADNGLWLGVRGQGYTYGTARVMEGLRAVDVDMDDDFVTAARGTLLSRQNDDGGWGEQTRYDPSQPESGSIEYQPGESTPIQTGWALQALLYGGIGPDREAVWDAVDYLLETQQSDGSWEVDPVLYTFGGPGYSTEAITQAAVLRALGLYESTID